jgi:alkyldihydroxyacetonephosphate synthase
MTVRQESFWGWGYADKFPDDDGRRALADRLEAELGFPDLKLLDPPALDEVSVPDSAVEVPDHLGSFCSTATEDRIRHTYGNGYPDLVRGFHGHYEPAPDVVARPTDEEEVVRLLSWASAEDVAVIPYGGGTSVVGGVEPDLAGAGAMDEGHSRGDYAGVVSLSLREFDDLLAVDEHSRRARIQAGMLGPEINDALREYDLQLRHYPQSYEFSTLGGWIATRAGGHFATKYTHIDDFVENVRAVTPAGTVETPDVPASGAGPAPDRLFLGSEGAFGAITDAWVRVQPRPTYRSRATVKFDSFEDGVAATREIAQARLYPANCRLLDPTEALINELSADGSTILVLGFESIDHPVTSDLERALDICESHGGECPDGPEHSEKDSKSVEREDTGGEWRQSFFEGPYLFNQLVSIGVLAETFETAITWDRFPEFHEAITREVTAALTEACGTGVLACRFTHVYPDGPAPYYTMLAPADVGNELEQWREIKRTASDVIREFGATITHHHAVGRVHREWYQQEQPDRYLEGLWAVKRTLDPAEVMNPGVLFEPDQST